MSKTISKKIGGTCRNIQGPGGVVFGEFSRYNYGKNREYECKNFDPTLILARKLRFLRAG